MVKASKSVRAMNRAKNSLGFRKSPADTRVVVAMSGGVDSSVVAAHLHQQGYDVVGITLQLYNHAEMVRRKGACCAGIDIHDARRIAEKYSFPHYVLDYESVFRQSVINEFAESYAAGYTPIPCIRCNQRVKFRELLDTAINLDADCLATGHYVQRIEGAKVDELHCAVDRSRDQSYFLFATTHRQLAYLRFPLGSARSKDDIRRLASNYGLAVANKPDSQDICFVPDGRYGDVIERLKPEAAQPGDIVDVEGNVLGTHRGVIHYTIGQRRRLGISGLARPMYVVSIEPDDRRIVIGPKSALHSQRIQLRGINWLGDSPFSSRKEWKVDVRTRSTRPPVEAVVVPKGATAASVVFVQPELAVAPGQACVFYDPCSSRVLGGGWIERKGRTKATDPVGMEQNIASH